MIVYTLEEVDGRTLRVVMPKPREDRTSRQLLEQESFRWVSVDEWDDRTPFPTLIKQLVLDDASALLLIIRNPEVLVIPDLMSRASGFRLPNDSEQSWLVVTPNGLDVRGDTRSCVFSAGSPYLWTHHNNSAVVDTGIDLYLLNGPVLERVWDDRLLDLDRTFESTLIRRGWMLGYSSWYSTELHCSLTGLQSLGDLESFAKEVNHSSDLAAVSERNLIPTIVGSVILAEADRREGSLEAAIRKDARRRRDLGTSLSILVRTEYSRPYLLSRLLASITHAALKAKLKVEVVLASSVEIQTPFAFPNSPLLSVVQIRSFDQQAPPRVANLVAALNVASADHCWLVDDDDYISADSLSRIFDALPVWGEGFLVMSSAVVNEQWQEFAERTKGHLLASKIENVYSASRWRTAFTGTNSLPICGYVFPKRDAQERIQMAGLSGDLSEDFALLLLLLTSPALPEIAEIEEVCSYISKRATSDTVTWLEDRTRWCLDIGRFLGDLQSNPAVAGPGVWRRLVEISGSLTKVYESPENQSQSEMHNLRTTELLGREIERLVQLQSAIIHDFPLPETHGLMIGADQVASPSRRLARRGSNLLQLLFGSREPR